MRSPRDTRVDTALHVEPTEEPRRAQLGRAAALITVCNLVSRISGFVRVIAIAGALGIAYLGDAYQRANEVSNVLFELLVGGLLFSVLVPSFVELLGAGARGEGVDDADPHAGARRLGSVLATRGVVVVGAIALVGALAGPWIMRALTVGTPASVRAEQMRLGSFLLWFIMPQLIFYAAGAVASALLQADHRFFATSIAPLFNNLVVIATMVVFAAEHDPTAGFALTTGEKVLLGAGTLGGTVAMTTVPFVALWHAGLGIRPRWRTTGLGGLRALVRRGAWAAGHVGLNEVLIGSTIVLSGRVGVASSPTRPPTRSSCCPMRCSPTPSSRRSSRASPARPPRTTCPRSPRTSAWGCTPSSCCWSRRAACWRSRPRRRCRRSGWASWTRAAPGSSLLCSPVTWSG